MASLYRRTWRMGRSVLYKTGRYLVLVSRTALLVVPSHCNCHMNTRVAPAPSPSRPDAHLEYSHHEIDRRPVNLYETCLQTDADQIKGAGGKTSQTCFRSGPRISEGSHHRDGLGPSSSPGLGRLMYCTRLSTSSGCCEPILRLTRYV